MTVELSAVEARLLGCLVEKSLTTPDVYPMTTNALVSACNQKTNRDPVVSYDARTVDGALLEMRQRGLVRKVHTPGARSTKHRQTLDEALGVSQPELVVLSVLMLRGAQTVGELRTRTERQHAFEDLESVERTLGGLAERGLVLQLERQPGQKERRWMHLLADPSEAGASAPGPGAGPTEVTDTQPAVAAPPPVAGASAVPAAAAAAPAPTAPATAATPAPTAPGSAASDAAIDGRVRALEQEVAALRRALERLAASLGEPLGDA